MSNLQIALQNINSEITVNTNGQGFITKNGLCVLLGISRSALRVVNMASKLTESLAAIGFEGEVLFENGVPDIAVACIVKHFALYAKVKSEVALQLLDAFTAIGVRAWFQDITGYSAQPVAKLPTMSDLARMILVSEEARIAAEAKIEEMKPLVNQLNNIVNNTSSQKGLTNIINSKQSEDRGVFTLADYLAEHSIVLDRGLMVKFSRAVADTYKVHNGDKPASITRQYSTQKGIRNRGNTNIYQAKDNR